MKTRLIPALSGAFAALACCVVVAGSQLQDGVGRRTVTLQEMAPLAKETYTRAIRSRQVGTINEITYRGAPVMYEIDQQMDRRRVEIVIRYDGSQVPSGDLKKPKVISKNKIELDKLPQRVSSAVARSVAPEAVAEVREVSYRATLIVYEVDSADHCYGYFLDGGQAFRTPLPTTKPSEEQQAQEDDQAAGDQKSGDEDRGRRPAVD